MTTTRIGVVGAGVLGNYHLQRCIGHPQVEPAGLYDCDRGRSEEVSRRFGVADANSLEELVRNSDAVIVATPTSTHYEIAGPCLEARRHVLVEKPLAGSHAEGEELVRRAQSAGVVLHVGHSEMFNPAFKALLIHKPVPRFMEIHRLASFSPRGTDVSVVLDLMVHDLHLVHRLMGGEEPAEESIAAAGVPVVSSDIDIANVRMAFASGCVVNLTASRISVARMRKLRIFQEAGYFSVDLDKREVVRCFLSGGAEENPVQMSNEPVEESDPLEEELGAFVAEIAGREVAVPGTTGAEALAVLGTAEKILQRLQTFGTRGSGK